MEGLVLIARNEKEIPKNYFFIKAGKYFLASRVKALLAKIARVFKEKNGKVYLFVEEDTGIFLDTSSGKLRVFNYTKDEEEVIRLSYPDLIVADLKEISPDYKAVKSQSNILNKNVAVRFVLLLVAVAVLSYYAYKTYFPEEEEMPQEIPQVVENTPQKPVCLSNIELFSQNYVYGIKVVKETDQNGNTNIYGEITPSDGHVIRVLLNPVPDENYRIGEIVRLSDTKVGIEEGTGDIILVEKDYINCLLLIELNSFLPITVEVLGDEGCTIRIFRSCLGADGSRGGSQVQASGGRTKDYRT